MEYWCFGAVAGDVIGSRFEFNNYRHKDFRLLTAESVPTDDTYLTVAVMETLTSYFTHKNIELYRGQLIDTFKFYTQRYPDGDYGCNFVAWALSEDREPYNSLGNGAAMRVSPCAYASNDLDECLRLAEVTTAITHNHPSALFWVNHLTTIIFMLRTGAWNMESLRAYVKNNLPSEFQVDLGDVRDGFFFNETCDGTCPEAIACVLEARDFEDTIRNAVSLGGDSDTLAAIAGAIAEPLFGIPMSLKRAILAKVPGELGLRIKRFSEASQSRT